MTAPDWLQDCGDEAGADLYVLEPVQALREEVADLLVIETAEQGPAGPAGEGAGSRYTHVQDSAASVWTVAHNLGRYPAITVLDHLGAEICPDVRHLDLTTARITHSVPLAGRAICN